MIDKKMIITNKLSPKNRNRLERNLLLRLFQYFTLTIPRSTVMHQTYRGLLGAKTLASNGSIDSVKGVITDSSPDTVVVYFQTSFVRPFTACQSHCQQQKQYDTCNFLSHLTLCTTLWIPVLSVQSLTKWFH